MIIPNTQKLTDPVGAKAPSFSSDSKTSSYTRTIGSSFSLLCLAQGYPTPHFRSVMRAEYKNGTFLFSDPVGSKAPSFSTTSISATFKMRFGQGFSLLCPAQGFPPPAFKYVKRCKKYKFLMQIQSAQKHRLFQPLPKASLLTCKVARDLVCCVLRRGSQSLHSSMFYHTEFSY